MNRNLKLALAALLGFSARSLYVGEKRTIPRRDTAKTQGADTTAVKGYPEFPRRVVVMATARRQRGVPDAPGRTASATR